MSAVQYSPLQSNLPKNYTYEDTQMIFDLTRRYHNDTGFMASDFESPDRCSFSLQGLDVELPIDRIKEIARDTGILQLRPINPNDRVLVVGCGRKPLANAAGYPISMSEAREYYKQHTHKGAVTINPYLANNPDIVAYFGEHRFPMLRDGQFDLIVIEGTTISDTLIGRQELQRLVSKTGQVLTTYGDNIGRAFTWETNTQNCWSPDFVMPPAVLDLHDHPSFSTTQPKKPWKCCTIL